MPKKYWIENVIKKSKKGALRLQAEREGGIDSSGRISKVWMEKKLSDPKENETVKRRIRLAMTLDKYRPKSMK